MTQTKAKIFLAGERGHTETDWFRSYNTFNFGQYQNEYKTPFGNLYVLNDDTLGGGKSFEVLVVEDSTIILMHIVGVLKFKDDTGKNFLIQAGECLQLVVAAGTTIQLANPLEVDLLNFIYLWFKAGFSQFDAFVTTLDLLSTNNTLIPLNQTDNATEKETQINCFIGKFDGRREGNLTPSITNANFFVFVIEGAFEVQNRLLENRDGLALWNTKDLEFEALSNDAILLIIEMSSF